MGRMPMPPEGAGQGALPKFFILAHARCAQISHNWRPVGARGWFPQKPHSWPVPKRAGLVGLPGFPGFPRSRNRIGEGEALFPNPSFLRLSGGMAAQLYHRHSRLQARNGKGRFPQKPHSWRIFSSQRPRGPVFKERPPSASEQGRGVGFPKSFILASVRGPIGSARPSPNPSYLGGICFRMLLRTDELLPKSLIIASQIPHFIPRILHSYPESFPKSLIGVPESFIIKLTSL